MKTQNTTLQLQPLYEILLELQLIPLTELAPFQTLEDAELFLLLKEKFQLNDTVFLPKIATKIGLSYHHLSELVIDPYFFKKFDPLTCQKNRIIPIYEDDSTICVATDNPYHPNLSQIQSQFAPKTIQIKLISSQDLNRFYNETQISQEVTTKEHTLLDPLLRTAIEKNASDIHVHKTQTSITISFRINGKLYPFTQYKGDDEKQLIACIKLHSKMDISIFNLPQDGRLSFQKADQLFDIRVSSLPTVHGEDFVLRLFGTQNLNFDLEKLGFSEKALSQIKTMLNHPNGLILVTGATGSGKTTTLYSAIKYLQSQKNLNIISLEDPVEYVLEGVRQSQVNLQSGHTFVNGLRSILRQDPDVIMIGEIRDQQTAKIALDAAYTGHLVLSTLHTASIHATLLRLMGFELDPFMVTQSLKGIISQKLIPTLCQNCRVETPSNHFKKAFTASGCNKCAFTLYNGRTVLSESLHMTNPTENTDYKNLAQLIKSNPFYSFEEDIEEKIINGIISEKEVILLG